MRKVFEPKLPAGRRREIFSLNDGERSMLRSKITVHRKEGQREREQKRTKVSCCGAKESVSVLWKRLMKTYPINPYYSECAWVPALARRPGLLRTRFALKPLSCVRNVCIAWHRMNSVTSMRMCACCMHSVDRPVSFCIFHLYNAYLHVSNVHTTCIQPSHAYACTRTLTHQHAREDLCGARYGIDFLSSTYVHTQS